MFTEDMEPSRLPRSGFAKDSVEVEGYVRGFARRRPDVCGDDAAVRQRPRPRHRHPADALLLAAGRADGARLRPSAAVHSRGRRPGAAAGCTFGDHPGTFNVAGDGVLMLSQAIARAGGSTRRCRRSLTSVAREVGRRFGLSRLLARADRVPQVRPRRRHHPDASDRLGSSREYTTRETFDAFVRASPTWTGAAPRTCDADESCLTVHRDASGCFAMSDARVIPIEIRSGRSRDRRRPHPILLPRLSGSAARWRSRRSCGVASRVDYEVDDFGFDRELTHDVLIPMLRPLYEKWFRVEVHGIENVPDEGGALIVANHSGTIALDCADDPGRTG